MSDITPDQMSFDGKTQSRFKVVWPRFDVRYAFWAIGRYHLQLPDRYRNLVKEDGRWRRTFCEVRIGWRKKQISLAQLARPRGLKIWAWREAPLKRARRDIHAALAAAKKDWDNERLDATSSATGKAIL